VLSSITHEYVSHSSTFVVGAEGRLCFFTNRHQTHDKNYTLKDAYIKIIR